MNECNNKSVTHKRNDLYYYGAVVYQWARSWHWDRLKNTKVINRWSRGAESDDDNIQLSRTEVISRSRNQTLDILFWKAFNSRTGIRIVHNAHSPLEIQARQQSCIDQMGLNRPLIRADTMVYSLPVSPESNLIHQDCPWKHSIEEPIDQPQLWFLDSSLSLELSLH